jgi:hypothetical protein
VPPDGAGPRIGFGAHDAAMDVRVERCPIDLEVGGCATPAAMGVVRPEYKHTVVALKMFDELRHVILEVQGDSDVALEYRRRPLRDLLAGG